MSTLFPSRTASLSRTFVLTGKTQHFQQWISWKPCEGQVGTSADGSDHPLYESNLKKKKIQISSNIHVTIMKPAPLGFFLENWIHMLSVYNHSSSWVAMQAGFSDWSQPSPACVFIGDDSSCSNYLHDSLYLFLIILRNISRRRKNTCICYLPSMKAEMPLDFPLNMEMKASLEQETRTPTWGQAWSRGTLRTDEPPLVLLISFVWTNINGYV